MLPGMENSKPFPLSAMARLLRVPVAWLRSEAEAGRVPHLKAGKQLLFDAETVQRILRERATGKTKGVDDVR